MSKILVLSPHSDDAEIGVGGYIAKKASAEGNKVYVALLGIGDITFIGEKDFVTGDERVKEFNLAMDTLGVTDTIILSTGYDSMMHMFPMSTIITGLDTMMDKIRPDEVLLPLPSSHQDHKYCWDVGLAATRPTLAKKYIKRVLAYEYPPSYWGFGNVPDFGGRAYVDVTSFWAKKEEALLCHKSQKFDNPGLIGLTGIRSLASMRGAECGVDKAELLYLLRSLD